MQRIQIIDSHTGGEPTRVVIAGGPLAVARAASPQSTESSGRIPEPQLLSIVERLEIFRTQHDHFRSAVVNEPRGSDVLVGALLCEPADATCCCGVIFFNNVGVLGMCGHGTIGLVATLQRMGRIQPGEHRIETCVGVVSATLHGDGSVSIRNVPSYRKAKAVTVDVPGIGPVTGDVAWGGNWFYLVNDHRWTLTLENVEILTDVTRRIRQAVNAAGFPEVDHVELFGPPRDAANHSRNFVLCPGKAYDRSPCGTGTSAKLACRHADGKLAPGDEWRQESIIGSVFSGRVELEGHNVVPIITGKAWITSEATLLLDQSDPFRHGIGPT
jgi:4-hydroxyproline epimerase